MTKTSNERVHDNVCAATCRMIMASKTSLPLNQVSETVPMLSLRSMYFPNLVIKSRALINLIQMYMFNRIVDIVLIVNLYVFLCTY